MIEIYHFLTITFHLSQSYDKERNVNKFPTIEREIDNIYRGIVEIYEVQILFSIFLHFPFNFTTNFLPRCVFVLSFSFLSLFYTTAHFLIDINYFTDRAKFNVASTFVSTSENTNSNTWLVDKFKRVLLKKIRFGFYKKMFLYPVRRNLSKLYKLITIRISEIDVNVSKWFVWSVVAIIRNLLEEER